MKYQHRMQICLLLANLAMVSLLVNQGWAQESLTQARGTATGGTGTGGTGTGSGDCPLPPADALGEDIAEFPRYPNSVRTRFMRETEKSIIWLNQQAKGMEAAYRSNDGMNKILEFYSQHVKEQGWELFSSNYMGENSIHMILSQGKRQILLILRPHTSTSPRRAIARRAELQPLPMPTTPTNCYVIQVFSWKKTDVKPLERRSRPFSDQNQFPGRIGR